MAELRSSAQTSTFWPLATTLVIAVVAIGLIAINAVWVIPSLEDVKANASRLRVEVAGRAADRIKNLIDGKITALQNGADQLRLGREHETRAVLERLLKENTEFNAVSLINEDLQEYVKVSRFAVLGEADLIDYKRSGVLYRIPESPFYYGDVFKGENLEPLMVLAVPVTPVGVGARSAIVVEMSLKLLSEEVGRFQFGTSGRVYAVDSEGLLIADPDISLVLRRSDLNNRPIVQRLLQSARPVLHGRHVNERNIPVEASGVFFERFGWGIIAEEDLAEVNSLRNRILFFAGISLGISFLLLLLLYLSSRRLVNANVHLGEMNNELNEVGKILIRRDLELTEANARLEEIDQVKSEFVSVAAHQLRTPLAGIRWSLHALADKDAGALNAEQSSIVSQALKATVRMIVLINDLLNVARIEEGRFGLNLQPQSITPLIDAALEHAKGAAAEKGVALSLELPKTPLPLVSVDGEKMMIVLDNLVDNAVKYTPPGGKITITVARKSGMLAITVADTGIGIPKDQIHRVFNKFFRADNALLYQTNGSGLGLYVVENIIKNHYGTTTLKSVENSGTTVTFTLPISKK